jgi:EAL domain-containing protein (putative c-di-GMP-specific phosphodiesterase class I)
MSDSLLERVLEPGGLRALFQPIFELAGDKRRLHGLECVMHGPAGTNVENTDVLFEYARRKRAEGAVDRACVTAALREAARLPGEPRLSLNVHASTLARDHEFGVFLGDAASSRGISVDRITVEILEHTLPGDSSSFLNALEGLRAVGAEITLDHVGSGHSNYRMMLECRPHYFKIDGYFVRGAHGDCYREAVLESVIRLAGRLGGRVVAECVEDQHDLAVVRRVGIDLVQGNALSPALPAADVARLLAAEGPAQAPPAP